MLSCTGIGICSAFIKSIYLKYPNNNILEINKYNSFFWWLWIRVCLPRRRLPYGSEWRRHTVEVAFTQDCKLLQCCVLLVRSWLPDWGLLCQFLSPSLPVAYSATVLQSWCLRGGGSAQSFAYLGSIKNNAMRHVPWFQKALHTNVHRCKVLNVFLLSFLPFPAFLLTFLIRGSVSNNNVSCFTWLHWPLHPALDFRFDGKRAVVTGAGKGT